MRKIRSQKKIRYCGIVCSIRDFEIFSRMWDVDMGVGETGRSEISRSAEYFPQILIISSNSVNVARRLLSDDFKAIMFILWYYFVVPS